MEELHGRVLHINGGVTDQKRRQSFIWHLHCFLHSHYVCHTRTPAPHHAPIQLITTIIHRSHRDAVLGFLFLGGECFHDMGLVGAGSALRRSALVLVLLFYQAGSSWGD